MNCKEDWQKIKLQLKTMDVEKLEEFIKSCNEEVFDDEKEWFCPNHPLEVPFYTYFQKKELKELSEIGMHKMYHELARRKAEEESFNIAKPFYLQAIKYNPVDLDILFDLAICYREIGDYINFRKTTMELYSYCFTRVDIAWFYRLLGNYYVEKMNPQIAKNLYEYSNLFFETEAAKKEIEYLQDAMKKKLKNSSIEEIQESLQKEEIPVKICPKTLAFVYKVAKQSIKNENLPYAKQLLSFLYEATGDQEVKEELEGWDE